MALPSGRNSVKASNLYFCLKSNLKDMYFIQAPLPLHLRLQEDETGNLQAVFLKDVLTAWHTYIGFLYDLGGIRIPTISSCPHWLVKKGTTFTSIKWNYTVRCSYESGCILSFNYFERKYNARDFDKSKSANLLKILKGDDLERIVNKVLGKAVFLCAL